MSFVILGFPSSGSGEENSWFLVLVLVLIDSRVAFCGVFGVVDLGLGVEVYQVSA